MCHRTHEHPYTNPNLLTCTRADVQLSPSKVALICSEEQLSLTCRSNQSHILRWMITLPEGNVTYTRHVSTITGSIPPLPIEIAGRIVTVHFSRQSADPLISTLSIDCTSSNFNGSEINCSTADTSEIAVIHVIDGKYYCLHVICSWFFLINPILIIHF